jgi:hypothetical protein
MKRKKKINIEYTVKNIKKNTDNIWIPDAKNYFEQKFQNSYYDIHEANNCIKIQLLMINLDSKLINY